MSYFVYFLLGISPASNSSWPTFRNPVSVPFSKAGCTVSYLIRFSTVTTKNYSVCWSDISKSGIKLQLTLHLVQAKKRLRKYALTYDGYCHYKIYPKSRTTNYNITAQETWLDKLGLCGSSVNKNPPVTILRIHKNSVHTQVAKYITIARCPFSQISLNCICFLNTFLCMNVRWPLRFK